MSLLIFPTDKMPLKSVQIQIVLLHTIKILIFS